MTIHPFSPIGRELALEAMGHQAVDLLVIGGGITGCGLARAAALRGYQVALVEKEDFASGTSSRSSKLVHGGVRYLATGDFNMVKESARERTVLKTIAPHLIHPLPFLFPLYKGDNTAKYRTGFFLFDKLAGSSKTEAHRMLSAHEVRRFSPHLRGPLKGALLYGEYMTDDARFTVMNAISAAEHGAFVANHAPVVKLNMDQTNRVIGATVRDVFTGREYEVKARCTVNATGPWAEQMLLGQQLAPPKHLLLSKGVHLIFSAGRIPLIGAVALKSTSGAEGFAIRRWNYVYIGTTDVPYEGKIDDPIADRSAILQLLQLAQDCFPDSQLTSSDILGTWAGLRPLILEEGKSARATSRHDEVWKIREGLFTIAGGKLTTYRQMANRVLKEVAKELQRAFDHRDPTTEVILPGGNLGEEYSSFQAQKRTLLGTHGISEETAERMTWLYGSAIDDILQYGKENAMWLEPLAEGIPALKGEVRLAVEREMAMQLIDFMDRRAALLLFHRDHGRTAVASAAQLMAGLLDWSEAERKQQIEAYLAFVKGYEVSALVH